MHERDGGGAASRPVAVLVHLSDLHLASGDPEGERVLPSLLAALARDRARRGRQVDLVVITGDIVDSATVPLDVAVRELLALHRAIQHVLGAGRPVPTVVVPGNHDRRRIGLFGPHRAAWFEALRAAAPPELWVHGTESPYLARVVPESFHRLPIHLVAYDSSYLPSGYLSAGGNVRTDDVLHAAAQLGDAHRERPVVVLMHHHLVPTPVTDTGPIETHRLGALAHLSLHRVLPVLVTHADREELTMTALGAGSALSALHSLGRPVVVLHGHKHIASARKLDAVREHEGDVLLASAGSAGTAQRYLPPHTERHAARGGVDPLRIWPSFNVVELDDDAMTIETVSFGWKGRSAAQLATRPLVWAERHGARWELTPTDAGDTRTGPTLASNVAHYALTPSARFGASRWDAVVRREVRLAAGRTLARYGETIEGLPDGTAELFGPDGRRLARVSRLPARVELPLGASSTLRVEGVLARTLAELHRHHGAMVSPYASVRLVQRYQTRVARLVVDGLDAGAAEEAFATLLDLGSGTERLVPVERVRGPSAGLAEGACRVVATLTDCPARSVLRVVWGSLRGAS